MPLIDLLVSIVTPAYKAERVIAETIRSVQAQSYPNWEMLIVEDGSPDGTADVVAGFVAEDSRVRLIRQANAGPAMARQVALDHARGRYIAFLDSDDMWLPNKLERQLAFMACGRASFTYTAFRRMQANGSGLGHLIEVPAQMTYRRLLGNTAIATSTVMIDRVATGQLRMTKAYYDDFALWLSILKRGHVAYGLSDDLMRYRVMDESVSRNKVKSARMVWQTYRDIESLSASAAAMCFVRYLFNAWRKYRKF